MGLSHLPQIDLNPCAPQSRLQAQQSMLGALWNLSVIFCYLSRLVRPPTGAPETMWPARQRQRWSLSGPQPIASGFSVCQA